MKVTVCQLSNNLDKLGSEWARLVAHVKSEASELILLPEMPFFPWVAARREFDPEIWKAAVESHDLWLERLPDLAPATVLGSRPVDRDGRRLNEGFVWEKTTGYRRVHAKYYLPDEEGFWEASWYQRGDFEFRAVDSEQTKIGFLICTEMWFTEHARAYGRAGVHILASPRATPGDSADKWVAGGRAAAVMSGAYCLSSNRGGVDKYGMRWAGTGWIIEPEEGEVLALTSENDPFVTREIDLQRAENAKKTYPRYVQE